MRSQSNLVIKLTWNESFSSLCSEDNEIYFTSNVFMSPIHFDTAPSSCDEWLRQNWFQQELKLKSLRLLYWKRWKDGSRAKNYRPMSYVSSEKTWDITVHFWSFTFCDLLTGGEKFFDHLAQPLTGRTADRGVFEWFPQTQWKTDEH